MNKIYIKYVNIFKINRKYPRKEFPNKLYQLTIAEIRKLAC